MSKSITIVGHSHVRRLAEYIRDSGVPCSFGFPVYIDFYCRGGWKIEDVSAEKEEILRRDGDLLILFIGDNDQVLYPEPEDAAAEIVKLAKSLRGDAA